MKTIEKFTGVLIGIFIMLVFCTVFKANAESVSVQTEYSPDRIYKYESECAYYGILIKLNEFSDIEADDVTSCINPSFNLDVSRSEPFIGSIQLFDRLNYIYNYTEKDNIQIFNALYGYEGYDINYLMSNGFHADNSQEADKYLEKILVAYKIYDNIYEYSHVIRLYVDYAQDMQEVLTLSGKIISVSDTQVNETGKIYYDIYLDESTDIYFADEILESLKQYDWYCNISKTEFVYDKINTSERIIAGKSEDYRFDDWNHCEPSPDITTEATTNMKPPEPQTETTLNDSSSDSYVTTTVTEMSVQPELTTTKMETSDDDPEGGYNTPDINRDGNINMADLVIISSILNGNTEIDSHYIDLADVNNDGVIDEFDYMSVCRNIKGYARDIKNITVNLNSCKEGADCYVKIMSSKDLSDMTGSILLQKNIFGKYISIIIENIDAKGLYYIFSEKYKVDLQNRYRLVADILYDDRRIAVDDNCKIT